MSLHSPDRKIVQQHLLSKEMEPVKMHQNDNKHNWKGINVRTVFFFFFFCLEKKKSGGKGPVVKNRGGEVGEERDPISIGDERTIGEMI